MESRFPIKKAVGVILAVSALAGIVQANEHVKPATSQQPAMSPAAQDNAMKSMQQNMQKMHDLMHRINNAKTPAERDRLNMEQRQIMQSNMQSMMPMMMQMMGGMGGMGGMGNSGGMSGGMGGMNAMPGMGSNRTMPDGAGTGGMPMQR